MNKANVRSVIETLSWYTRRVVPDSRHIIIMTATTCGQLGITLDDWRRFMEAGLRAQWSWRGVRYNGAFTWTASADWSEVRFVVSDWAVHDDEQLNSATIDAIWEAYSALEAGR